MFRCFGSARATAIILAGMLIGSFSPGRDARAAQSTICIPTTGTLSGLVAMQDVNAALAAILSTNSGASAPSNDCSAAPVKGQIWLDTSTNLLKQFDGANWVVIALVDGTNHIWTPPVGGGTATLASAGTTDLWSVSQAAVTVTGTTSITAMASASAVPGTLKIVKFSGALTLTYNATSLILPTAANITTAAGDYAFVLALTNTNVAVVDYVRATGAAVLPAAFGTLTNLASATTTDLGTIASHNVNITGITTITGFGSSAPTASPIFLLKFAGALTLTYNASSMILPGATNVTTVAGDTAVASYLGSGNWQVLSYNRATANVPRTMTAQTFNSGSSVTYTTPAGVTYIRVQMCAGGGGGGQAGGGSNGSAGGDTSFGTGTTLHGAGGVANGGLGGVGGSGGVDLGTVINRVAGGTGQSGMGSAAASANGLGGMGGSSVFGGAGAGTNNSGGVSARANSCSGGGGAGGGSAQNGGAGGGAGEFAEFLIVAPAATYTYTVGAGGGASTGGTGAGGKIIVSEF